MDKWEYGQRQWIGTDKVSVAARVSKIGERTDPELRGQLQAAVADLVEATGNYSV